jgi:hypothetical protein
MQCSISFSRRLLGLWEDKFGVLACLLAWYFLYLFFKL